jgi:hypothetical protein
MCKKCEGKKYEGKKCECKKNIKKLSNQQNFVVVNNPNYSVEIQNNFFDSALQTRNAYPISFGLFNILVN